MSIINQNTPFIQPHYFIQSLHKHQPKAILKDIEGLDYFRTVHQIVNDQELLTLMATFLEEMDLKFMKSSFRKNNYYVKDKRERTIMTSYGLLRYKRRVYIQKANYSRYYYIDEYLGVRKYQRVEDFLKFEMLKQLVQDKTSYQKVAQKYSLSKSVVYYTLKNLNLADDPELITNLVNQNKAYLQVDEHYVSLQKQKAQKIMMIKQATYFTGVKRINKSRNKLINRHILTQKYDEGNQQFYRRVYNTICQMNPNLQSIDIITQGDGASWIQSFSESINAKFYIDRFHFHQALNRCIPREFRSLKSHLLDDLRNDRKQKFKDVICSLHHQTSYQDLDKYIKQNSDYILKHAPSYFEAEQLNLPGCSAEGMVSHYLASLLTRHPKAYCPHNASVLASLVYMHLNRVDITRHLQENKFSLYQPTFTEPLSASNFKTRKSEDIPTYTLNLKYISLDPLH